MYFLKMVMNFEVTGHHSYLECSVEFKKSGYLTHSPPFTAKKVAILAEFFSCFSSDLSRKYWNSTTKYAVTSFTYIPIHNSQSITRWTLRSVCS